MWTRDRIVKVFVAVLGVFTCTAFALAEGGTVLPASAHPTGSFKCVVSLTPAPDPSSLALGL